MLAGALIALALVPTPAVANLVCADYPDQAAAQRAADPIDADHDGIFCEALPCPCLKVKVKVNATRPAPAPVNTVLGASRALHRVTRSSGCRVRGGLPDPRCTPGARFSRVTRAQVCQSGFARSVRHVTSSTKSGVYAAYGMDAHFDGADGEVDH